MSSPPLRAGLERIVETVGTNGGRRRDTAARSVELRRQADRQRPCGVRPRDNASLTRLVVLPGGGWLLRSFNDTAHLSNHA